MTSVQKIRLPNAITTQKKSIIWLKRITSYIVSNILYLRQFFDEESYTCVDYETHKLRILSRKSTNDNVQRIIDVLEECFEALEDNRLMSITMGIFEVSENGFSKNAVEVYNFDYTHCKLADIGDVSPSGRTFREETSMALKNLLESLRALKPFPGRYTYYLMFKLEYKGFKPENEGFCHFVPLGFDRANSKFAIGGNTEAASLSSGSISSNFHKLSIHMEVEMLNLDTTKLPENLKKQITVPNSNGEQEEEIEQDLPNEMPVMRNDLKRKLSSDSADSSPFLAPEKHRIVDSSSDGEDNSTD